jgi:hypothetical protein
MVRQAFEKISVENQERLYGTAPLFGVVHCAAGFGAGLSGGALAASQMLGVLHTGAGFAAFLAAAGLIMGIVTVRAAKRIAAQLPANGAV